MEIELLRSNTSHKRDGVTIKSVYNGFDLTSLVCDLKQGNCWVNGELNSKVLIDTPDKKILLTALREGTEIESFQTSDSVSFQILEGELQFWTSGENMILKKGQLLTLSEKVKYSLTSGGETVFLLTLSNKIPKAVIN
jgi:quercetin dioxygenase-like cupin family protein